jgi:enoyl-CoA hydratase
MNPKRGRQNSSDKREKKIMSVSEPPEGVTVIELNLGKANAINYEFLNFLNNKLDVLENKKYKAAVITGYDRFFSSGLDLVELFEMERSGMKNFMANFKATFLRLFTFPKPIVAAINGHAIAGGCVMALACDYRIMGRGDALIGLNEVKLGIGLPTMVIEFARAALPPQCFPQVLLMGETFPPQRALAMHLIDELVEPTTVLQNALEIAAKLAIGGQTFSQIKRDLRTPITEHLKDNSVEWLDLWFSVEAREKVAAIRTKLLDRHNQKLEKRQRTRAEAAESQAESIAISNESAEEGVEEQDNQSRRGSVVIEEPLEGLERISDEEEVEAAAAE